RVGCAIVLALMSTTGIVTTKAHAAGANKAAATPRVQSNNTTAPDTDLVRRIVRSLEQTNPNARSIGLPSPVTDADFRPLDPAQVELG
ncbi:MAG TPA: hypothetical protein DF699_09895, partial [Phycisphaerales bacterium]|nr:hypothetical protein [Phycisphaerales bacterium]